MFAKKKSVIGSAYLVGFEKFRPVDRESSMLGDSLWYKDIYRHPSRQGAHPEKEYKMQHDIYSLGVCLLEIGIRSSFVGWKEDGKAFLGRGLDFAEQLLTDPTRHEASRMKPILRALASNGPLSNVNTSDKELIQDLRRRAFAIKRIFEAMATELLPSKMGCKYAEITRSCLTCLDEGNQETGDESELQDEDGLLVGTRYMERVQSFPHNACRFPSNCRRYRYNFSELCKIEGASQVFCGSASGKPLE